MKRIIVEIIPEAVSPDKGNLVQISALKLDDLKLIDRFDYRLSSELITNPYVKQLVDYDMESFNYLNSTKELLDKFSKWSEDIELLVMNNEYTNNFLGDLVNEKKYISTLLGLEDGEDFIDQVIKKYSLEETNYIVDLLYEALIYQSNNK